MCFNSPHMNNYRLPAHAGNSTAISIGPPCHFISNQAYASISWDGEKEVCFLRHRELSCSQFTQIRIYHLGPGNILQEYVYSERKGRNSRHYGNLHTLKVVLDPTSSFAAIRLQDSIICIYILSRPLTTSPFQKTH